MILLTIIFFLASARAAGLPVLDVNTDNARPVDSLTEYVPGEFRLSFGAGSPLLGRLGIRGRGNSTWQLPKKPYRLKLAEKSSLFGFPLSEDWVLLSNYADKSLIRNFLALEFSRSLRLAYTPRAEFVDFSLNGQYRGNYLFTEQIQGEVGRVPITKLKKTDITGEALTGGYLLEISQRMEGPFSFRTKKNLPFTLKAPQNPQPQQAEYISSYVQAAEDALFSPRFNDPVAGYAAYFDLEQFVDWYLVNELFRNQDAAIYSSIYLYKERSRKLAMGPVWDFDISAGNVDYDENFLSRGWWIQRRSPWYARLFADPAFAARVAKRWREIRSQQVERLFALLRETALRIDESQQRNFWLWPIFGRYDWPNYYLADSYEDEVIYLETWLKDRVAWLDEQWRAR